MEHCFGLGLESKPLFLSINMEFNFSGSDVNVSICSTQEGSRKYEGCLHVLLHVKYYKIYGNKKVSYFYQNILSDSCRVRTDWSASYKHINVGVSVEYLSLSKTILVKTLTFAPRSHNAFIKFWVSIEQSIVGHLGSFFLTGEVFRMAALYSSINLITSVEGSGL